LEQSGENEASIKLSCTSLKRAGVADMSVQLFLEQTQHLKKKPNEKWLDFTVQYRDIRGLKLNILTPYTPFLTRPGWDGSNLEDWRLLLDELTALSQEKSFTLLLVFLTDQEWQLEIDRSAALKNHLIAILDKAVLAEFVSAHDWNHKWRSLGRGLTRCVGRTALNPYVIGTPAFGGRFFGRSKIIEQITSGKTIHNCTIVGNRRIGKTSLMAEVKERLKDVYVEGKTIFFANLYAANFKSTWDAVYLICSQLNINIPQKFMKYGAISERYIRRFPSLLHAFTTERQADVVIFIDEFDHYLEIDSKQNYEFLHLLREAIIADTRCHVLIAGFRRLMETRVRRENPYFNFATEIALTPLTRDEVVEMITVPLDRLGVDVQSTNIPITIQRETRGQPELVQMYCLAVVALCEKLGRLPTDNELHEYVRGNRDLERMILQAFLNSTNPYEQLICLRLIQRALQLKTDYVSFSFTYKDVEEIQVSCNFPLNNAATAILLNNLVVGSIIQRVAGSPGDFQFAVPHLIRLCSRDISVLLTTAQAAALQHPLRNEALYADTNVEETASFHPSPYQSYPLAPEDEPSLLTAVQGYFDEQSREVDPRALPSLASHTGGEDFFLRC
jgi:hypothetical protein